MISLVVAAVACLAGGFIVWGLARRRARYGIFLLPGLSVTLGLVVWVVLELAGIGSSPDAHWLLWALPPVVGVTVAAFTARSVGVRREARDNARLEEVLRL